MAELQILNNGLPLIYIPKKNKIGHLVIHFNHGSSCDPDSLHGAVHLLEHMLFKGTRSRNYLELICGIEHLGADINAFTTKENMVIHVSYPDESLESICEILSDIVNHSVFNEKELKKEKQVIIDEIKSYRDTPEEFIYDEWEKMMLNGNGLSHAILGTEASVRRMTLSDLNRIYRKVCSNYQISVVSCRNKATVTRIIRKYFTAKAISSPATKVRELKLAALPKTKTINDDVSQAHVIIGRAGPHFTHEDQLPVSLLASFLGGNAMSSILNMELREKRGISYTVETSLTSYRDTGLFFTYFTCDKLRMTPALQIISKIVNHYKTNGLTKEELTTLIRMTKSQYAMFFENPINEAMYHAKFYQYYRQIASIPDVMKELGKIKLSAINKMALEMLDVEKFHTIVIDKK